MVEYILLVTAVVLVCYYFFSTSAGGPMQSSLNTALNGMVNSIDNINSQIQLK